MAKNDLLTIGLLAGLGYVLFKGMNANALDTIGGGGGGGGDNPPVSPDTPFTPLAAETPSRQNLITSFSAPTITAETQAAISRGELNIFGQAQITTPPSAPFIKQYNQKVAQAVATTGDKNISSTKNLIAQVLPATMGVISGIIQSAAKAASSQAQSDKNRTLRGYYVNGVWVKK